LEVQNNQLRASTITHMHPGRPNKKHIAHVLCMHEGQRLPQYACVEHAHKDYTCVGDFNSEARHYAGFCFSPLCRRLLYLDRCLDVLVPSFLGLLVFEHVEQLDRVPASGLASCTCVSSGVP